MIDHTGQTLFSLLKGLPKPAGGGKKNHFYSKTAFGSAAPSYGNYSLLRPVPPPAHQLRHPAPKRATSQRVEPTQTERAHTIKPEGKPRIQPPKQSEAQVSTLGVGYRLLPVRLVYPEEAPKRTPRTATGPPSLTTATRVRPGDQPPQPQPQPPRASVPEASALAPHRRRRSNSAKDTREAPPAAAGAAEPPSSAPPSSAPPSSAPPSSATPSSAPPSSAPPSGIGRSAAHAAGAAPSSGGAGGFISLGAFITVGLEIPEAGVPLGAPPPVSLAFDCSSFDPLGSAPWGSTAVKVGFDYSEPPPVSLSITYEEQMGYVGGEGDHSAATHIQARWRAKQGRREADDERARLEAEAAADAREMAELRQALAGNLADLDGLMEHITNAAACAIQHAWRAR